MTAGPRKRRSPLGLFPDKPTPRLYDRTVEVLRVRHDSRRAEQAYFFWIRLKRGEISVRQGNRDKDRAGRTPQPVIPLLREQPQRVQAIDQHDLADRYGHVELPHALARKYPNASRQWRWQFVFPQEHRWQNPHTGEQGRHHMDESLVQRAVTAAVRQAGTAKRLTSHTFRHLFATHLLAEGYDIRTVQELLGHRDVRTTMTYTDVLNRGGRGVPSPADGLPRPDV